MYAGARSGGQMAVPGDGCPLPQVRMADLVWAGRNPNHSVGIRQTRTAQLFFSQHVGGGLNQNATL